MGLSNLNNKGGKKEREREKKRVSRWLKRGEKAEALAQWASLERGVIREASSQRNGRAEKKLWNRLRKNFEEKQGGGLAEEEGKVS